MADRVDLDDNAVDLMLDVVAMLVEVLDVLRHLSERLVNARVLRDGQPPRCHGGVRLRERHGLVARAHTDSVHHEL